MRAGATFVAVCIFIIVEVIGFAVIWGSVVAVNSYVVPLTAPEVPSQVANWPILKSDYWDGGYITAGLTEAVIAYQTEPIPLKVEWTSSVESINGMWHGENGKLTVNNKERTPIDYQGDTWGDTIKTVLGAYEKAPVCPAVLANLTLDQSQTGTIIQLKAQVDITYPAMYESGTNIGFEEKSATVDTTVNLFVASQQDIQARNNLESTRSIVGNGGLIAAAIWFFIGVFVSRRISERVLYG